jgi:hypothetical protein
MPRHGAIVLEAYPVAATRGRVSPSSAFHGVQSMYERAGFTVVETRQWNKSSPLRPIMASRSLGDLRLSSCEQDRPFRGQVLTRLGAATGQLLSDTGAELLPEQRAEPRL